MGEKGYARSIVQRDFEYIYLGAYHIKTVSMGLAGIEIGGNSREQASIQISTDDWEVEIPKSHNYDWYRDNVIYYGTQDVFKPVNDTGFLDEYGEFNGKRYRLLEIQDRKELYFKLLLRVRVEERLPSNGFIYGQTTD